MREQHAFPGSASWFCIVLFASIKLKELFQKNNVQFRVKGVAVFPLHIHFIYGRDQHFIQKGTEAILWTLCSGLSHVLEGTTQVRVLDYLVNVPLIASPDNKAMTTRTSGQYQHPQHGSLVSNENKLIHQNQISFSAVWRYP